MEWHQEEEDEEEENEEKNEQGHEDKEQDEKSNNISVCLYVCTSREPQASHPSAGVDGGVEHHLVGGHTVLAHVRQQP